MDYLACLSIFSYWYLLTRAHNNALSTQNGYSVGNYRARRVTNYWSINCSPEPPTTHTHSHHRHTSWNTTQAVVWIALQSVILRSNDDGTRSKWFHSRMPSAWFYYPKCFFLPASKCWICDWKGRISAVTPTLSYNSERNPLNWRQASIHLSILFGWYQIV